MIILTMTDTLLLELSAATNVDFYVAYIDTAIDTPGTERGSFASSGSQITVCDSPDEGQRIIKTLTITNTAVTANTITLSFNDGAADAILRVVELQPNETFIIDERGMNVLSTNTSLVVTRSPNYLVGGGFDFAQRQLAGTDTNILNNAYGPDQWKVYQESNHVFYSRQTGVGVSGLNCQSFGRFTKATNGTKFAIANIIENHTTQHLLGRTVTFQVKMKSESGVSRTWRLAILESQAAATADAPASPLITDLTAGTGVDPTLGTNVAKITPVSANNGTINGTAVDCVVTDSWQVFGITVVVPTNSKNLICAIWSNADVTVTTGTLSVAEAGLYDGSQQQPWLPKLIDQEYLDCARYCFTIENDATNPARFVGWGRVYLTTAATVAVHFPNIMRTIPTLATTPSDWRLNDGVLAECDGASFSLDTTFSSTRAVMILATASGGGLTVGRIAQMYADGTLTRRMIFEAGIP